MPCKRLLSKWWLCISVSDLQQILIRVGFPGGSVVKNPPANAGDTEDVGSIPALGRSPGGGNGDPLQYSCLGKSMDRGAWEVVVHGVTKSWTWLSNWHTHYKSNEQILLQGRQRAGTMSMLSYTVCCSKHFQTPVILHWKCWKKLEFMGKVMGREEKSCQGLCKMWEG